MKKQRKKLFDRLSFVSKDERGNTVWRGEDGARYVLCHLSTNGKSRPFMKVIRNGDFFTGMFKTKKSRVYSGDILLSQNGGEKVKRYLTIEAKDCELCIYVHQ